MPTKGGYTGNAGNRFGTELWCNALRVTRAGLHGGMFVTRSFPEVENNEDQTRNCEGDAEI